MSDLSLHGQVAIITGSGKTRGIGAAIATLLSENGASVVINYVSPSTADQAARVARSITDRGGRAIVVKADISTPSGAQRLVDCAVSQLGGKINILINNAAGGAAGPIFQTSFENMQRSFGINVIGPLLLIQAAVPHMPPRSRIINIGSVASRLGVPNTELYGATKAAMDALTYSMAHELGRNHGGITINTVSPGPVDTDGVPAQVAAKVHGILVPMSRVEERVGTAADVADAILLLCSERSRWISGQCISVSGGITGGQL